MMHTHPTTTPSSRRHSFWKNMAHAFPPPGMLDTRAAGIDISDASVRWVVLEGERGRARVASHGNRALKSGTVEHGIVTDPETLVQTLREIKAEIGGIVCVHAALPEETAYVFSMHVPNHARRDEILRIIEFELDGRVPIPAASAIFDYDIVTEHDGDEGAEIAVMAFPRDAAEQYARAFADAGLTLLSLEVEASSIARAVCSEDTCKSSTLLVDFGRLRTGFAVLKHGVPIFTSTADIGGEDATQALMKELNLSAEEVEKFKDEEGLRAAPDSPGLEALAGSASAFADEIARHYRYWDTRRDKDDKRTTPIEHILLVGGGANVRGIADFVARRAHAEVTRADVWGQVCSFDDYIPPIDYRSSLQYVTAIGLALRSL